MNEEDIEFQIQQQGAASYKVEDGEVFVFTVATLEKLLCKAHESGKGQCIVFVKTHEVVWRQSKR